MPTFALVHNENTHKPRLENRNETWQFISDNKKDSFLICLQEHLLKIDLTKHPEDILASLTEATITAVDSCFPIKSCCCLLLLNTLTTHIMRTENNGEKCKKIYHYIVHEDWPKP